MRIMTSAYKQKVRKLIQQVRKLTTPCIICMDYIANCLRLFNSERFNWLA